MDETASADGALDRPLDDAERRALLALPLPAVFSTVAPDGSVHSVPVHFVFIGELFRFIAASASVQVRTARTSGRGRVCGTATVDWGRRYVTAEGPVQSEGGVVQAVLDALDLRYQRESPS